MHKINIYKIERVPAIMFSAGHVIYTFLKSNVWRRKFTSEVYDRISFTHVNLSKHFTNIYI